MLRFFFISALYGVLLRIMQHEEIAEDLLQETLFI